MEPPQWLMVQTTPFTVQCWTRCENTPDNKHTISKNRAQKYKPCVFRRCIIKTCAQRHTNVIPRFPRPLSHQARMCARVCHFGNTRGDWIPNFEKSHIETLPLHCVKQHNFTNEYATETLQRPRFQIHAPPFSPSKDVCKGVSLRKYPGRKDTKFWKIAHKNFTFALC